MLSRYFLVLTLVLATSPALVARTPEQVSVAQLMSTPDRFRGKQISVVGYFDPAEVDLRGRSTNDCCIAVELSDAQAASLKRKGLLKSGWIRIQGTFEYVGCGKVMGPPGNDPGRRIPVLQPTGFRGGGASRAITHITDFMPVAGRKASNQTMKPTAPCGENLDVFATTPWISSRCPASLVRFASSRSRTPAVMSFNATRGLSLSR